MSQIGISTFNDIVETLLKLSYCSWHGDNESGMAVTEVHMLSGYVPEETDQELLQRVGPFISRVEIKDKSVIFYMDEVGAYSVLLTHKIKINMYLFRKMYKKQMNVLQIIHTNIY